MIFENGITSEIESYILGFLYADGYVSNKNKKGEYCSFGIGLSAKDYSHIIELSKYLPITHKKRISKIREKEYESVRAYCGNKTLTNKLISLGISPNKTYQNDATIFNNISNELKSHFIRGYFDGDGSIYNIKGGRNYGVGFVSINEKLLIAIEEYFCKNLKIANKKLLCEKGKYYRLRYVGNPTCNKLMKFLYKDATIYLNRKKEKFNDIPEYHSKVGISGITEHKHKNNIAFKVVIPINGYRKYLGLFNTVEEALNVRNNEYRKYGITPKEEYW